MKKCVAIGEALIDFIPNEKGKKLKDVLSFKQVVGGAPANVAASVSKLGGSSVLLTKLGRDAFGDKILDEVQRVGIDTSYIKQDNNYDTSLAFVSLASDGNRDFKFYRKTAADLAYSENDVSKELFDECGIFHFCSVSLVQSPMKQAHKKCIEICKEKNVVVSFDPNLRLSLWDDHEELKTVVQEFMQTCDILKLSDEELEFITGYTDINEALPMLFNGGCQFIVYTKGKDGVTLYCKDGREVSVDGFSIDVKDTTGAGDSFIGAFLYKLLNHSKDSLMDYDLEDLEAYLRFANAYAAYTTTKEGALGILASHEEIMKFINEVLQCKKRVD